MIKEKLLDKNYYLSKLSMFMKESYGIEGNVDLMLDWMKSINSASVYITNVLDIWNPNYKNDMISKFKSMYITRVSDETPAKYRGQFKDNVEVIDVSNIKVNFSSQPDVKYSIVSKDDNSFYAVLESEDENFDANKIYYYLDITKEDVKDIVSPKSLNLYEYDSTSPTNPYYPSEDNTFESGTTYYKREEINVNDIRYSEVNPKNLRLYEGDLYYFNYIEDSNNMMLKTPSEINLKKIVFDTSVVFDNSSQYIIKGNYIIKATPLNSNINATPLLEYNSSTGEYSATSDTVFLNGKDYYRTALGGNPQATPQNCKLVIAENVNDTYFKQYIDNESSTDWFRYCIQNNDRYVIAYPYSMLINLYYFTLSYDTSLDTSFAYEGKYYEELSQITNVENANSDNVGIQVYIMNGSTLEPLPSGSSFVAGTTYYNSNGDVLCPSNLKLLEQVGTGEYVYSSDTVFTNKVYKVPVKVSPVSLNLWEYNANDEFVQSADTEFLGKTYYNANKKVQYPYLLGLTSVIEKYELCAYLDNENFYYKNYYIDETFEYQKYNNVTHTFDTNIELSKFDSYFNYESPYSDDFQEDAQEFKMLDVIASIVGCTRENKLSYIDDSNVYVEETIRLSNEDLLDLIKIKIIQNNYKGTLKELLDLYKEKLHYNIYITLISKNPHSKNPSYESAACNVYLEEDKNYKDGDDWIREPISENIKKMFKYSDLFIQSLGIKYNKMYISDLNNILVLNKDYLYKNEKAIYSIDEKEEAERRATSVKLG